MKKISFILIGLAVLFGCQKEEDSVLPLKQKTDLAINATASNEVRATASFQSGKVVINLPGAIDYNVVIPESEKWLNVISVNSNSITLSVDENATTENRSCQIRLVSKDREPVRILNFTQYTSVPQTGDLIIDEVYFIGNKIRDTKFNDASKGCQYIIIKNNSDHKLYAGGTLLLIGEILSGAARPNVYFKYPPQDDFLAVSDIFQIPDNGNKYELEPGETLLIAFAAKNFKSEKESGPTGKDLSNADFEIYEISSNAVKDTDNPDVPNMLVWVKKSYSYTVLHQRGFYGLALAMPPAGMTADKFLSEYKWNAKKTFVMNGRQSEITAWKIPESWALDAVNMSRPECMVSLPWNEKMDKGYTYCGRSFNDNPYGTCVKRKKLANGKSQDTNNSSNDFIPEAQPSL